MVGGALWRGLSVMKKSTPKLPLVIIIGATGTGKSKLAVSLASKYNGEIINGDAVQMYKGLPIVTNKIPEVERNAIPHHIFDFIDLNEAPWTVHQFVKESDKLISDIHGRGKLPVVVGGTHYYVHGLLMKDAMLANDHDEMTSDTNSSDFQTSIMNTEYEILHAPTSEIYAELQRVDPEIALYWHPNDRRHIQRSLEIWLTTGQKASEIYSEQKQRAEDSSERIADQKDFSDASGLRYDPLILWLDADDSVLKTRLNARVDTMVETGLIDEVKDMQVLEEQQLRNGTPIDKSKGVWVAIGYKEMEPWLKAQIDHHQDLIASANLRSSGIEAIKAGTRQYAKRQNRFIRLRLANSLDKAEKRDALFLLDSTILDNWTNDVEAKASELVDAYLQGNSLPPPKSLSELARVTFSRMQQAEELAATERSARHCDTCRKTLMTTQEWSNHLKSRGHKKAIDGQKKWENNQKWLSARHNLTSGASIS